MADQVEPKNEREASIVGICEELCAMLVYKNRNYGDSAFQCPALSDGITPFKAILVRMSDKINRIRTLLSGTKDAVGESVTDTLMDLAGYSLLAVLAAQEADKASEEEEI